MATIKTPISIEESLLRRADELAAELKISRSRLVSLALEQLIHDEETKRLVERLNEAYANGPTEEELLLPKLMAPLFLEILDDDDW